MAESNRLLRYEIWVVVGEDVRNKMDTVVGLMTIDVTVEICSWALICDSLAFRRLVTVRKVEKRSSPTKKKGIKTAARDGKGRGEFLNKLILAVWAIFSRSKSLAMIKIPRQ